MVVLGEWASYVIVNEIYIVEAICVDMYAVVNIWVLATASQIVYSSTLRIFGTLGVFMLFVIVVLVVYP